MRSYRRLIAITLIFLTTALPVAAQSQPGSNDQSEVFRQLLAMPAPPPSIQVKHEQSLIERPDDFFDWEKVPADDALQAPSYDC